MSIRTVLTRIEGEFEILHVRVTPEPGSTTRFDPHDVYEVHHTLCGGTDQLDHANDVPQAITDHVCEPPSGYPAFPEVGICVMQLWCIRGFGHNGPCRPPKENE